MLDRRGILVDLRGCSGGDERRAQELAARFLAEPVVYARSRVRSGPAPTDLSPPEDRWMRPREGRRFDGPVVCLVGPGCLSSGEGFALMMAAIPGVVLAGKPTAGQSGNPHPVELPNGVTVVFSRWLTLLPDGTPLEGRGVPPDRPLDPAGAGDPTFREGLAILEEMAAKAGR
jgi:carboxyl-terminal processing protease